MSPEDLAAIMFSILMVSLGLNLTLGIKLANSNDDYEATKRFLKSTTTSRDKSEQRYHRLLEGLRKLLHEDGENK